MRTLSMLQSQHKLVSFSSRQSVVAPCFQLSALSSTAAVAAAVAAPGAGSASRSQHGSQLHPQRCLKTSACRNTSVGLLLPPLPSSMGSATQAEPLSLPETLQAVAVPPTGRNLGPRVEHMQVASTGQLSDAVASALQLPQWFVLELMRFGAVHFCPVMPPPSHKAAPRMSPQHLQRMQQLRAAGIAKHGKNPKLQVPRRFTQDCTVEEGGYIRVHVHPKRFPAAYSVDWRQRVLADTPEYVVVDKPAGVQVPPTVDNLLENVASCTAAALGLPPDALTNTHRLDVGTSGVVVLAKGAAFAAWFSSLLKNKPDAMVKTYRCLTSAPPPLGHMVHWARLKQRQSGEPAHTRILLGGEAPRQQDDGDGGGEGGGALRCELIVQQVQQVELTGAAAESWGPCAYESTLQLVSGRTHQIRAQMAAVGCPLLGDQLYSVLGKLWQQEQREQQQQQQQQQQQADALQQVPGVSEAKHRQQHEQHQEQQQHALQGVVDQSVPDHVSQDQLVVKQQEGHEDQQHNSSNRSSSSSSSSPAAGHRHGGAHWSRVYQEDPSRPIGLQAARLRVRNVAGRMTGAAAAAGTAEEEDGHHEVDEQQQPVVQGDWADWVEFEAGTPWWRQALHEK